MLETKTRWRRVRRACKGLPRARDEEAGEEVVGSPGGSLSRLSHTKVCATVAGSNSLGHQANLETARLWTKTYRKKSGEVFFPTRSQSPRVSLDE